MADMCKSNFQQSLSGNSIASRNFSAKEGCTGTQGSPYGMTLLMIAQATNYTRKIKYQAIHACLGGYIHVGMLSAQAEMIFKEPCRGKERKEMKFGLKGKEVKLRLEGKEMKLKLEGKEMKLDWRGKEMKLRLEGKEMKLDWRGKEMKLRLERKEMKLDWRGKK